MRFIYYFFLFLPPGSISEARLSEKQVINLVWPKLSSAVKVSLTFVPHRIFYPNVGWTILVRIIPPDTSHYLGGYFVRGIL